MMFRRPDKKLRYGFHAIRGKRQQNALNDRSVWYGVTMRARAWNYSTQISLCLADSSCKRNADALGTCKEWFADFTIPEFSCGLFHFCEQDSCLQAIKFLQDYYPRKNLRPNLYQYCSVHNFFYYWVHVCRDVSKAHLSRLPNFCDVFVVFFSLFLSTKFQLGLHWYLTLALYA